MKLLEYASLIRRRIIIEYRPNSKDFMAHFFDTQMKNGKFMEFPAGYGDTPVYALNELAKRIRGKRLIFAPYTSAKAICEVPDNLR